MNLLNGFTGLFSLGQAGFMLVGAYTYAVFTIPRGEAHGGISVLRGRHAWAVELNYIASASMLGGRCGGDVSRR